MQRYYRTKRAVLQLNAVLLENLHTHLFPEGATIRPINERFLARDNLLEVRDETLFEHDPSAIMESFLLMEQHSNLTGFSVPTARALLRARPRIDAVFRRNPRNRELFMNILRQPQGVTHVLRRMSRNGILGRYLPAFGRIVGQMQHDLFHVYTVDQHILMVLRNVRRFFIAEHAHEYPFCSQLAGGWDKPWILYVAALFHDIAKGRGGDHSELGAHDVRRFCRLHGIEREDAKLIEFLVQQHLSMSRIAQKSDLSDSGVIAAFAKRVGNERNLTALYLLTVADIRGTSPKVWNAWKGKLLEDLYRLTLRTLGGHAVSPDAEVEARKREALVQLALHSLPFEAHKPLWDTLDVSYFMRHDAADIAWHTRQLSRLVGTDKAIVRTRRSTVGEGLQVLVYVKDQPDLFARICGYFDQGGFSILDARIHTTRNGYALDTFQVVTPVLPEHYRELTSMVEVELAHAIADAGPLPEPSRGRLSRRVKSFPVAPRVSLHPDEKAQHWLLNISASDQAGLLYKVARVLARHHINLQLAKINTLGERVDDVFLIDGAALQNSREQIEVETELLDVLAS
jgi:[protein-PII] uridylyltransferase